MKKKVYLCQMLYNVPFTQELIDRRNKCIKQIEKKGYEVINPELPVSDYTYQGRDLLLHFSWLLDKSIEADVLCIMPGYDLAAPSYFLAGAWADMGGEMFQWIDEE